MEENIGQSVVGQAVQVIQNAAGSGGGAPPALVADGPIGASLLEAGRAGGSVNTDAPPARPSSESVELAAEFADALLAGGHLSVDAIQIKNRWLGDLPGTVAGGLVTRRRVLAASAAYAAAGYSVRFVTFTFRPGGEFGEGLAGALKCWQAVFDPSRRIWGDFLKRLEAVYPGCQVFMTLEPHPGVAKDGTDLPHKGWPHCHALIYLPSGQRLDYGGLWKLWTHGSCKAEIPKGGAASYCCKYLTKGFDPPEFFDSVSSCVHMTRTTHGFWRVLGPADVRQVNDPTGIKREVKTVKQIRSNPLRHVHTLLRIIDCTTGQVSHRRLSIDISTLIDVFNGRGVLGGMLVAGFDRPCSGRASFSVGSQVKLDYSRNCGMDVCPQVDTS